MGIEIIGAGALGLLFGSKLAAVGEKVRFWTRTPEQSIVLRTEGIRLMEADGKEQVIEADRFEVSCLDQLAEETMAFMEAERLFLTLKQRDINDALLSRLKQGIRPDTQWVCFQNGLGHLEKIRRVFPDSVLLTAITTEGAKRTDGRSVIRAGYGETKIGGGRSAEEVANLLEKAAFKAIVPQDINTEIYRKLLINAAINPLTALWQIPNGQLLATEERRTMLRQLSHEGEQVCAAYDIDIGTRLYEQITAVCEATFSNISSMLKDVQEGKPTEVDYINGQLVGMAHAKEISVPGHEVVWRLVRAFRSK